MRKEFSPKNLCVYALKYFLIVVILAVVGLGAGLLYSIVIESHDIVRYEGNLAVVGISEFYGADLTEGQVAAYGSVRDTVLNAMVARKLINQIYNEVGDEWKTINGQTDEKRAQESFYKCFSAWRSDFYVYVEMKMKYSRFDNTDYREKMNAFAVEVINRYQAIAVDNAYKIEAISNPADEKDRIIVTNAYLALPETKDSLGLLKGMCLGLAGGLVVGLLVVAAMYLFDGRITSYGDIAELTGKKLLGVNDADANGSLYPNIDCEMTGNGSLLVCGGEKVCRKIAEGYVRYSMKTGRSVLLVDCGKSGDSLGEYMAGKPLSECVKLEDGIEVLYGGESWQAVLRNSDKLSAGALGRDLVVFSASYSGDGRLNVLVNVCEKFMVAVDQKAMCMRDVLALMHETRFSDKVIGAAIENTGKSFVGGTVYLASTEEEVQ